MTDTRVYGMHLPWRIEESAHWPFDIRIMNSENEVVLTQARMTWASSWKKVEDCLTDKRLRHQAMVEANRRQMGTLQFIVAAANKTA